MPKKVIRRPSGDSILLKSKAKINLSLDVLDRRPDGYHTVEMIMQTISLYDEILIKKTIKPHDISLTCSTKYVPVDSRNVAWKAARLLFDEYPDLTGGYGVDISIKKNIPVSAGLAGGSGNCAATLQGMNQLFNLNLSKEKLMELGLRLGADVPYCLQGGTMLARGIGEDLTELPRLTGVPILLINPNKPLSTAKVYSLLDMNNIKSHPDTASLLKVVERKDIAYLAQNTVNVLEEPATRLLPEILNIKEDLMNNGALGAVMSGSGPSVFGIYENMDLARRAFNHMKKKKYRCYLVQTI